MNKTTYLGVIGVLAALIIGACGSDDTCTTVSNPLVHVGFYVIGDEGETDTTLLFFSADGLVENDSDLYVGKNLNAISLPLSQLEDSCSYRFTYSRFDSVDRTVRINDDTLINTTIQYDTTWIEWDTVVLDHSGSFDTAWTIRVIDSIRSYPRTDTTYTYHDTIMSSLDTTYFYDKLTFFYKRNLHIINEACGFEYLFDIDSIITTDTLITNFDIIKSNISISDEENVKIYF